MSIWTFYLLAGGCVLLLGFCRLKPRTEEFLYLLLWSAERLMRPTFRNLNESFEGWAYRSGLHRHLAELERQQFLERQSNANRIYRLTEKGRMRALGGRDPEQCWSRPWDGAWRLICFDVPVAENRLRRRLRQYLRNNGFGLLQRSLWITPDSVEPQVQLLRKQKPDVKSMIFLHAGACGGEHDADIVQAAWDFERINGGYRNYLKVLKQRPTFKGVDTAQGKSLLRWANEERLAWKSAITPDPLLPTTLLPRGYLGRRAWRRRIDALKQAGRSAAKFPAEGI